MGAAHLPPRDHREHRPRLAELIRRLLVAAEQLRARHENLGDVQVMLALRSYARALQLDPAAASVPGKLALLRQLLQSSPAR